MITKHGKKRLKKRLANSPRSIKLAIEQGEEIDDFKGAAREYLCYKSRKNEDKILRVFNKKLFIFSQELSLITVLNIPG